jgi:TatD DNase family protein
MSRMICQAGRVPERDRDSRPEVPEPLPIPVVDSHCHLDVTEPVSGLAPGTALRLAASVGVTRIVQVGCDVEGSRWAVAAAQRWPAVVAAVAIHPNDAARLGKDLPEALTEIERLAHTGDRVRAVGETGLDFFRTRDAAGQAIQRDSFAAHIAFAKTCQKTLVIHDRDAHPEILEVLDAEGAPDRIVMHCFSGDADFARSCLDRGAFLSFAGTVTFKNAEPLRSALRVTPLDRILTETDAPYLTPMPFRGRPNASYLIPHTARFMAEVLGIQLDRVCHALNDNADVAFAGVWGE